MHKLTKNEQKHVRFVPASKQKKKKAEEVKARRIKRPDCGEALNVIKYAEAGYTAGNIAKIMGISRTILYEYYQEYYKKSSAEIVCRAAKKIVQAADTGNLYACKLIVTNMGGWNEQMNAQEKEQSEEEIETRKLKRVIAEVVPKSGR